MLVALICQTLLHLNRLLLVWISVLLVTRHCKAMDKWISSLVIRRVTTKSQSVCRAASSTTRASVSTSFKKVCSTSQAIVSSTKKAPTATSRPVCWPRSAQRRSIKTRTRRNSARISSGPSTTLTLYALRPATRRSISVLSSRGSSTWSVSPVRFKTTALAKISFPTTLRL